MHSMNVIADGVTYQVHYNSDWSGPVHITGPDGLDIEVPGSVLIAVSIGAATTRVRDAVIRALEDL